MNKNQKPTNFTFITYQDNGKKKVLSRKETRSKIKFVRELKRLDDHQLVYLRVAYQGGGWNDGYYCGKDDLWVAFKAFTEV